MRRGGCAPNICFGLAALGLRPLLIGAAGHDFEDYRAWLTRHGVDTAGVHIAPDLHTARFLCTTDRDMNQLASFYPGAAMTRPPVTSTWRRWPSGSAAGLWWSPPTTPDADAAAHRRAVPRPLGPLVADPSQQLARIEGDEIAQLVDGAAFLLTNDYEAGLLMGKTGWDVADVLDRVGVWVVTKGAKGCPVSRRGAPDVDVPAVPEVRRADPTGVGDAFRAGFLAGVTWGVGLERAAQVASLIATYVLETVGTQEYDLRQGQFQARFADFYGSEAADEITPFLPAA